MQVYQGSHSIALTHHWQGGANATLPPQQLCSHAAQRTHVRTRGGGSVGEQYRAELHLQSDAPGPRQVVNAARAILVQVSKQLVQALWGAIAKELAVHLENVRS